MTMPRVPSAPMNNLVKSNPAADFRALWRVFMISPSGRTTVCKKDVRFGDDMIRKYLQCSRTIHPSWFHIARRLLSRVRFGAIMKMMD